MEGGKRGHTQREGEAAQETRRWGQRSTERETERGPGRVWWVQARGEGNRDGDCDREATMVAPAPWWPLPIDREELE